MNYSSSILVFTTQHMPTGGIESHVREFCYHFVKSEVDIDLVVLNSAMLPETMNFFRGICRKMYLGRGGNSLQRLFWLFHIGIKLCFKRYNAVYTNGHGNSIIFLSKLLFRAGKWVHHYHTSGDTDDQSTWSSGYRHALLSAAEVIACSNRNAINLEKVLQRPVLSIPCFSREIPVGKVVKRQRIRFGYYGRLIPEKGIDILCQLSEDDYLKHIEFHIWGEGTAYPPAFFEGYPCIKYHGTFSGQEELTSVMESIDGFLLLSVHPEGLPICLLEAMSAGLPWLATDQGGIPDIALDPIATRVIPASSDYSQIKDAILSFSTAIQTGKVSRKNQMELYSKKFSSFCLIKQWRNVFGLGNETNLRT